ncbi:MAG: DNA-binding protein [Clostridiales bacterium]|nr:DNA-binding protein [Clostridiales bacterium]
MRKEKTELSLLLDYYGAFLTEKQRMLLEMNADEDMSLSEIAEVEGVTRQGVRAAIVNASEKLTAFEEKLGLIVRDQKLRSLLDELEKANALGDVSGVEKAAEAIRAVIG